MQKEIAEDVCSLYRLRIVFVMREDGRVVVRDEGGGVVVGPEHVVPARM